MKVHVTESPIPDVVILEIRSVRDERGFFLESWNRRDFSEAGLDLEFVQEGHSRSGRGVLRGLHYQDMTAPMGKLVRCTVGVIFDVAVDLRAGTPKFGRWFGLELSAENQRQLYVPVGCAHGFAVLSDAAEVQYKQTGFYTPSAEGVVAWNDPDIGIAWPITDPILSTRDRNGISLKQYLENPAFC